MITRVKIKYLLLTLISLLLLANLLSALFAPVPFFPLSHTMRRKAKLINFHGSIVEYLRDTDSIGQKECEDALMYAVNWMNKRQEGRATKFQIQQQKKEHDNVFCVVKLISGSNGDLSIVLWGAPSYGKQIEVSALMNAGSGASSSEVSKDICKEDWQLMVGGIIDTYYIIQANK